MPKTPKQTLLLFAVSATLSLMAAGTVVAQDAGSNNRRGANKEAQQAEAPKYPNASRKEPDTKAGRNGKKLEELGKAYNAQQFPQVLTIADEVIADSKSNNFERAYAARLAGASQLNTDNAKATAYLLKAVELNGLGNNDHYEAMFLAGRLQAQEGQVEQGLATIDKMLSESKSQDPEQLIIKGDTLYKLQRYPEAVTVVKQALAATPNPKPEWQGLLLKIYADSDQPAEAAKLADEIASKNPTDKQAQLNAAAAYMQADQNDKAVAILEKLRSSGQISDEKDYRNLYALYSNAEGKEKEAIAVINEGLQKGILKPDYQTYTALAQAYWFSDQPDQAADTYRKAAPLAPDGEAYLNLAKVLNNTGKAAEAKQAAQQALDKGVKNPEDAKRIISAGSKGK